MPGPAWYARSRRQICTSMYRRLGNRTAGVLPRYASEPHKDPRAPQNLYPIAGLERELRRCLGDAAYVEHALRAAAGRPLH